jgi:4-hydroxyphenylpyruvate dioxygenase
MKFGIATVSLSGTLENKLHAAAAAGFDGVEIFENDLVASPLRPRDVRALMNDLGLTCQLYQPFRDFEGMPGALRQRALDRAAAKFDLMGELGVDRILVCSNCSPQSLGERMRIVDDLSELARMASRHGIVVGYEALAWGRHVFDHRDAWAIVEAVDHPSLGIILDSFHSLSRGIPSDSIRDIPGDRIAFVQLADAPRLEMDLLYWSRHFRNFPGQGGLDVAGYVAEILRTGYSGPLSLEIFNDRFRAWSAEPIARDGLRSLQYVHDEAQRRLGCPVSLPASPERVTTEFVEFAVDEEQRPRLEAMLGSLGFTHTGTHRSKQVNRWQAGKANLVVNAEQTGFAHSYNLTHGPAICAVGLTVPDRKAVVARADFFGVSKGAEIETPGNLGVPAIRGVGGSLIYLIDEGEAEHVWDAEFIPTGALAPSNGLTFDHLATVVQIDEFLSWQLFWRSLFGFHESIQADVIDPAGLVLSLPLQSRDGATRITMNATDASGTLSARFVNKGFGGGYQHVAFATPDLLSLAHDLHVCNAELLAIPDNYYDDLAARLGNYALVDELRHNGILYDSDADGEYQQLYSRAFDKLFFFEFVRRRDYKGFGAYNAGFRLAAQERFKDYPLATRV